MRLTALVVSRRDDRRTGSRIEIPGFHDKKGAAQLPIRSTPPEWGFASFRFRAAARLFATVLPKLSSALASTATMCSSRMIVSAYERARHVPMRRLHTGTIDARRCVCATAVPPRLFAPQLRWAAPAAPPILLHLGLPDRPPAPRARPRAAPGRDRLRPDAPMTPPVANPKRSW